MKEEDSIYHEERVLEKLETWAKKLYNRRANWPLRGQVDDEIRSANLRIRALRGAD